MAKASELKARWSADALVAADRAFVRMDPVAAYQGKPPPFPFVSPFGEHDGLADFRGLPFGTMPVNRLFERVDLSDADNARNGQPAQCRWVDCRFDRIRMETNLGKVFVRCSFVGAKLSRSVLDGEFTDCDFSHADLAHCGGSELKFTGCNFDSARLVGLRWLRARFERCTFKDARIGAASFANSTFIGGRPDDGQLTVALIPGVVFQDAAG